MAISVFADVAQIDFEVGDYVLSVLYDPLKPPDGDVVHVRTVGNTIWAVAVHEGVTTDQAVCMQRTTREIIVGPRPCSSIDDYFCEFGGPLAVQQDQDDLAALWSLSPQTPECYNPQVCFGPVGVSDEFWDPESGEPTDVNLLRSRSLPYVVSRGGPNGEVPFVTFVPIIGPSLNVTGNCSYGVGQYDITGTDDSSQGYTNVTYAYGKEFTYTDRRINFVHDGAEGFVIEIGDTEGSDSSLYRYTLRSKNRFADVADVVNRSVDFDGNCTLFFQLIPAPRPFQMVVPMVPDDLTYAHNVEGKGFVAFECAIRVGTVDHLGQLVHPDVPPGVLAGGRVRFRSPGPLGQPYRVLPNKAFTDFVWDCDKWFPIAGPFLGYASFTSERPTYDRDSPDTLQCFVGFPNINAIDAKRGDPEEKMRQCRMLGGYTALTTMDYCAIDVATTLCRLGWFFFDGDCYYFPDTDTDSSLQTIASNADTACGTLRSFASSTSGSNVDSYLDAWLKYNFVLRACETDVQVRILVSGRNCDCYSCVSGQGLVTECDCEIPMYPLCRYAIKDDYIAWNDMKWHPATLDVMKNGQCSGHDAAGNCLGLEAYGAELVCDCFPGSTGPYCVKRSCVNTTGVVGGGPFVVFMQACAIHGGCVDAMPNDCGCDYGYGPPVSYGVGPHTAHPCWIPATIDVRDPAGGYVVDNVTYTDSANANLCNGKSAGSAVCDLATQTCFCQCALRQNLDPLGPGSETAFDGVSCAGELPMPPPGLFTVDSPVIHALCNMHGTSCPSGERATRTRLDGTITTVVDADACRGVTKPTCACDDGWSGGSCTIPVPTDVGESVTFIKHGAYVSMGSTVFVSNARVVADPRYPDSSCTVTNVSIGNAYVPSNTHCVSTAEAGRYWCNAWGAYVVIVTVEERPACAIQTFTDNDLPCGNHTNSWVARFFANEFYRAWGRYDVAQSQVDSMYGGSLTACMSDSNWTGRLTRSRVSSLRLLEDGSLVRMACGEETSPKRGEPTDDSGCVCGRVGPYDFSNSTACQCALVDGMGMCGGMGKCVDPVMPWGRCEFDVTDAAASDLAIPLTVQTSPTVVAFTFATTSIVAIANQSWIVYPGTVMGFESIVGTWISTKYQNGRFPVNVTHECLGTDSMPVRATADVIHRYTTFVCDPSDVSDPSCWLESNDTLSCDPAWSCPTSILCNGKTPSFVDPDCVEPLVWYADVSDERVLTSGRYEDAWLIWVDNTTSASRPAADYPYGRIDDCSNPVMRWIDDALYGGGYVSSPQCVDSIPSHSNVLGALYGIFDDAIPGLDFSGEWTSDHYALVTGVTNGLKCSVMDALNDEVVDDFALYIIDTNVGPENSTTVFVVGPSTPVVSTTVQGDWGFYGSDLTHVEGMDLWPHGVLGDDAFAFSRKQGFSVSIPANVRIVEIVPNTSLGGLQVVGPQGRVCGTVYRPISANETIRMDCGDASALESNAEIARRVLESTATNKIGVASAYVPSTSTIWYVPLDWTWTDASVGFSVHYTWRSTSPNDYWDALSASILVNKTFPTNVPFQTRCAKLGGSLSPFDLSKDARYVQDSHGAYLARRRCVYDWECRRFARGPDYRCVFDTDTTPALGWFNGDPAFEENPGFGMEGGCDCDFADEISDPALMCSACVAGYEATWDSVLQFENDARSALNTSEPVLVNLTDSWVGATECTLPSATSGRSTSACGGARGTLRRDFFTVNRTMRTYSGNRVKRCESVFVDGSSSVAESPGPNLDIHSFFGAHVVNVVYSRVFVDGVEWTQTSANGVEPMMFGTHTIECVPYTFDADHRVRTFSGGTINTVFKPRDFWTDYVFSQ